MAAHAVKLFGGSGAFRGISGPLPIFLAFSEVRLDLFRGVEEAPNGPD